MGLWLHAWRFCFIRIDLGLKVVPTVGIEYIVENVNSTLEAAIDATPDDSAKNH
jgi:hypothetical protein